MELKGKVHFISDTVEVGNNGFTKRQIVIATEEQYVQYIPIDFVKDKTSLLDKFTIGQEVEVSVNVRGSEYQGKYYVNLQGWKITANSEAPTETKTKQEPANLSAQYEQDPPF
ncbi:MAG: Flavobacterium phage vB FspS lillamy9 [Bacteroidota bacterium]|jgi:YbbR domain-containing protein